MKGEPLLQIFLSKLYGKIKSRNSRPYMAVAGFGLAHVVLGAIDLAEHRSIKNRFFNS
jgi:hypothetical protein